MLRGYHCSKEKNKPVTKGSQLVGMELEFMPSVKGNACKFGVGHVSGPMRFSAYLENVLFESGISPTGFVFERDGSLHRGGRSGVEMISRPGTFSFWINQNWEGFFQRLKDDGLVELGHDAAGMHLHVEALPRHEGYTKALWHRLAVLRHDDFQFYFGRERNEYCGENIVAEITCRDYQGVDEEGEDVFDYYEENKEYDCSFEEALSGDAWPYMDQCRYVPLNCTPEKTSELRMFPSPMSSGQVLGALKFAREMRYPSLEMAALMRHRQTRTEEILGRTALGDGFLNL